MRKPENPPAFPNSVTCTPMGDELHGFPGMTLRDWFAGQALSGLIAEYANPASSGSCFTEPAKHAAWAYSLADAMLAARSKGAA